MGIKDKLFGFQCEKCRDNRTKRKTKGQYICSDCELKIKAESEIKRECPVCKKLMKKEVVDNLIIDCCVKHGVWLDKGELEHLASVTKSEESTARISGMCTGLIVGSALN